MTFSYNPASQITSLAKTNDAYAWTGLYNVNRPYASNGLNQYTQSGSIVPTYDARGNLTSAGTTSYSYTAENMLSSTNTGVSLGYDPLLRLAQVTGTTTTKFAYDGVNALAEYDGGNLLLRRYVFGPSIDEPLVQYEGSGILTRRWLHADERGSIIAVSDDSGAGFATNSYDEYGIPASANYGRFQYTGQMWLPELGMYHYKARIYSPTLGRFLQTDPIGYGDGPNWYNYVGGDPVNWVDPLGLEIIVNGRRLPPPSSCSEGWVCYEGGANFDLGGALLDCTFAEICVVQPDVTVVGDKGDDAPEWQRRQKRGRQEICFLAAVFNNKESLALNTAGALIPGASTGAVMGKLAFGGASLVYGAATARNKNQLTTGVGLGIVGWTAASAEPEAAKWAKISTTAKAIPIVGNVATAFGLGMDVGNVLKDTSTCITMMNQ